MDISGLTIILGGVAAALATAFVAPRRLQLRLDAVLAQRIAWVLILVWTGLVGTLAILQHLAFNSSAYDLGIFDQVIWNSAHGRLFENSVMADSPSFLGHHFSPILLALAPLYWVYPDPVALLAVQAVLLAIAGIPIYLLARDLLGSQSLALALLVAYLLHPATAWVALFDFHEVAIAAPLLSAALYLLLRRRYAFFAIALALTFLTKEEMGLIGAAIGVFIVLTQRRWLIGIGLAALGTLWTLFLVSYVIPSFHPSGEYYFKALYANLGSTPQDILTNFLRDPSRFLRKTITVNKQAYLQMLFLPLGLLPLLGWPALVVSLPPFLSILLSDQLPPVLIRYQYSATLLPPLLMASVTGLRWLRERIEARWFALAPGLAAFVVATAALGAYFYGPLPMSRNFEPQRYQPTPRLEAARQLMAQIPPEASIIAQSGLLPQLSHRRTIQLFAYANPALRPDFYFLDTDSKAQRYPLPQEQDYPYLKALSRVAADAEYRLVAEREGYLLFKRETPELGRPVGITFGDQLTLVSYRPVSQHAQGGDTLRLTLFWRAEHKLDTNYTLFVHLEDRDGKIWGQRDGPPAGEYFPTSEWEPGRLLRSDWSIPVAQDAPSGNYRLVAGLYNLATMQRLAAADHDTGSASNSITLQTLNVSARQ